MLSRCSSLTSLDLSTFNTSSVTSIPDMFDGCSSLNEATFDDPKIRLTLKKQLNFYV